MGIQINGQTDTISAVDGALTVSGAELPTVTNLNATGISTFSKGIVIGTGTSISSPTTNTLTLGTNNAERVRVSAGGVSIGTVATYGDSNASFTSLSLGGNGTRYGLLEIKQSNGVAGAWIDSYGTNGNGDLRITTAGTSNNITFWTGGAFTEKVRIDSSGNLGIGITNPSQKLEVVGGEIKAGRVDSNEEGGQVSFGRATDNATGWYIDVYGNTSTPSLRFVDVSNSAVRATIDSSGRLTLPYQPFVFVVRSANVSMTSGSKIPFDTVVDSRGLTWNTTNNNFVVPATGVYTFSIYIRLATTSVNYIFAQIRSNGTALYNSAYLYLQKPNTLDSFQTAGMTISVKLTQNDTVDVTGSWNVGTHTLEGSQSLMSIVFNG